MATIKEVAKECGVSIATVSNILNGKGRVSEETKERILAVAKEMNYVPNMMAKNLKQRHTKTIGIITEDLTVFNSAGIVDGINACLDEKGYSFLLGNLRLFQKYDNGFYHHENYHAQVRKEFALMKSKQVDGVIYIGAHCREMKSIPEKYGIPIVVAYGYTKTEHVSSVQYDDEHAFYMATEMMIEKGHKQIGVIAGEEDSGHTIKRERGYQKALYDHSLLYNPGLVYYGGWTRQNGYAAAKKLIQSGVKAILTMSDVIAAGVYNYAAEAGLRVGRDVSVMGFDNREISQVLSPELSTVEIPLMEIGRKAAEVIVRELEEPDYVPELSYEMQCSLINRSSVTKENV